MWFITGGKKCNGNNVELIHIFLSGGGSTGKSHLVKLICTAMSKTLLYLCKDPACKT